MKHEKYFAIFGAIFSVLCILFLGGCQEQTPTPPTSDLNSTSIDSSSNAMDITTDDSIWYSEKAGVRGRIWLGMTEKEVYDVLTKYNIEIDTNNIYAQYDEYGAAIKPAYYPYSKEIKTLGHQYYEFDENNLLVEITYFDQLHNTDEPVNNDFFSEKGVKRRDSYEKIINLYGEPDKEINVDDGWCYVYVYKLENGNYILFTFTTSNTTPLLAITYSQYNYPLFDSIIIPTP